MSGISVGGHRELPQLQKTDNVQPPVVMPKSPENPVEQTKADPTLNKSESSTPKTLVPVQEMQNDIDEAFNTTTISPEKSAEKAKKVFDIPENTKNYEADLNKLMDNGRVLNKILGPEIDADNALLKDSALLKETTYADKPEHAKIKDINRADILDLVNKFNPSSLVKELDKTILKDKVYAKGTEIGKNITQNLSKDMMLGIKLSSNKELKEVVANSIAVKDKYHESYDKALSKYTEGMGKLTPLILNVSSIKNDDKLTKEQKNEKIRELNSKAYDIAKKYDLVTVLPEHKTGYINIENIKNPPSLYSVLPENKQKLVNSIVSGMLQSIPDKASAEKNKIENVDMPNTITINNKTYGNPVYIAQGGLGAVFKYQNPADKNDTVIVKNLLESDKRDEMIKEIKNHTHAMGDTDNNPNIINLKGVVKGAGEDLYMVMETAKTDNDKLKEKFDGLATDKVISPKVKNDLTNLLAKDMLNSMVYLQKEKNMIHLDLKLGNYLVNNEGKSVLADFGSSRRTQGGFNLKDFEATQIYASPEVLTRFAENQEDKKVINEKSDVWSFGMVLHDIVHGKSKLESSTFSSVNQESIIEFGKDFNNRLIDEPKTAMDNIINAMCHPDPSKRPTFEAILKTSVFSDPALEKPELRNIIKEMISGNPDLEKIKKLSTDLS